MPIIRFSLPDGSTADCPFEGASLTMGSGPECDLVISQPSVIDTHAQILWNGETWQINDLGGGCTVRERFVDQAAVIRPGDMFTVGEVQAFFLADEPAFVPETVIAEIPAEPVVEYPSSVPMAALEDEEEEIPVAVAPAMPQPPPVRMPTGPLPAIPRRTGPQPTVPHKSGPQPTVPGKSGPQPTAPRKTGLQPTAPRIVSTQSMIPRQAGRAVHPLAAAAPIPPPQSTGGWGATSYAFALILALAGIAGGLTFRHYQATKQWTFVPDTIKHIRTHGLITVEKADEPEKKK